MNNFIITLTIFLSILNISAQEKFIKGIDISSLLVVEKNNGEYLDDGQPVDALSLFKDNGTNYVRLRLWHSPADSNYNLEYNLELAERVKSAGMNLLLDIFYSDTWADPGQQFKPNAWQDLSFEELKDSVYQYSFNVVLAFKLNNCLPDMIQIGNEINCGFLWDEGKICGEFDNEMQWNNFTQLLITAYNGIKDALTPSDSIKIVLQSASGGDVNSTRWFFDNVLDHNVNFDLIGLSYYPWWHGTLDDLEMNLHQTALRYNKEIIVVETAYPWTLDWNDNMHNLVGLESQLLDGYPATPEGQKQFLLDEIDIIKNTPNELGVGWFYWEPAYISTSIGSSLENLAMFDFDNKALPAVDVFQQNTTSVKHKVELTNDILLYQNFPNPFNPSTRINFSLTRISNIKLKIFDITGEEIRTLLNEIKNPGQYKVYWNGKDNFGKNVASGIYIYSLSTDNKKISRKMVLIK